MGCTCGKERAPPQPRQTAEPTKTAEPAKTTEPNSFTDVVTTAEDERKTEPTSQLPLRKSRKSDKLDAPPSATAAAAAAAHSGSHSRTSRRSHLLSPVEDVLSVLNHGAPSHRVQRVEAVHYGTVPESPEPKKVVAVKAVPSFQAATAGPAMGAPTTATPTPGAAAGTATAPEVEAAALATMPRVGQGVTDGEEEVVSSYVSPAETPPSIASPPVAGTQSTLAPPEAALPPTFALSPRPPEQPPPLFPLNRHSTASDGGIKTEVSASVSGNRLQALSAAGHYNYKDRHGWRMPGLVDEMEKRLSNMCDLPLEDATPKEEKLVEVLREKLLAAYKLSAPPSGWRNQHFARRRLLAYLRSRGGDVEKAFERAVECVEYLDHVVAYAREYEAAPEAHRTLADQLTHGGQFGKDKRGASVSYMQFNKNDVAAIVKQTSFEFYTAFDWYSCLFFWDTLNSESEAAGVALNGRLLVVDVSGISLGKIKQALDIGKKLMAKWPQKEHPMPEGFNRTIVCNVPWMAVQFWGTARRFFPKRDADRVKLFTSGEQQNFVKELLKHVDKSEIPKWIGGESNEPWPYGKSFDAVSPPWRNNPLDPLTEVTRVGHFARRVSEMSGRGMHNAVGTVHHVIEGVTQHGHHSGQAPASASTTTGPGQTQTSHWHSHTRLTDHLPFHRRTQTSS